MNNPVNNYHPIVPQEEPVLQVKGRMVKESDLDLIDLTPNEKKPWREVGACDYHCAVHRGYFKIEDGEPKWHVYSPRILGFMDCNRSRMMSLALHMDEAKVRAINKVWKRNNQLVQEWNKADVMPTETEHWDKLKEKGKLGITKKRTKSLHPMVRMWYRMKVACDAAEKANPGGKEHCDMVRRMADWAMKLETLIQKTNLYVDVQLEKRVAAKKKTAKPEERPLLDADAEVVENLPVANIEAIDRQIEELLHAEDAAQANNQPADAEPQQEGDPF